LPKFQQILNLYLYDPLKTAVCSNVHNFNALLVLHLCIFSVPLYKYRSKIALY
jgi:hypothetical protein